MNGKIEGYNGEDPYMIVYKDIRENTLNVSTLSEAGLRANFRLMARDDNISISGVYKKIPTDEILDIYMK